MPYHICEICICLEFVDICLQLDREITAEELMVRREIRKNVTQALTSLPVSSLLDLDQMTSALLQSTVGKRPVELRILTR